MANLLKDKLKTSENSRVSQQNAIGTKIPIFSEKKLHEIQFLDISARKKKKCIDINLIKKIRSEIFVPLSVGGGINNIDQISQLIN